MEQQQSSLYCLIHKQPAYFLLFRNSNTSAQPPNQSVIKCSICIVKEKIKGDDLIALPEIMNPTIKQFSSDVSHLGEELDEKIKYMRMHYDSIEGINQVRDNISKFFDTFRKELELKLNESEKLAFITAEKIQENLNIIFKKHEEIVSKNDLQGIIEKYSSNNDNDSDNTGNLQLNEELKGFFESQQKNKQANISILQNLLKKFEREKSTFNCQQPNLQKDRILDYVKSINFFVVSNSNNERTEEEREKCDFQRYIEGNTEMIADIFAETARIMAHHPIDLKEFKMPKFKAIELINNEQNDSESSMEDEEEQSNQSNSESNDSFQSRSQRQGEEDEDYYEEREDQEQNDITDSSTNHDIEDYYNQQEIEIEDKEVVNKIDRILNKQTVSQQLLSLASLLRSIPCKGITAHLNNNIQLVKFDMLKSQLKQSSKVIIIKDEQKGILIHNPSGGRIIAYSDFILNPKLKYLLVVDVINHAQTGFQLIGLTSDSSKDTKTLHFQNYAFSNNDVYGLSQNIKGKCFSELLTEQPRFKLEFQICLEKQQFIVSDYPSRQNINAIPDGAIDLRKKYRLGVELFYQDDSVQIQSLHVVDSFSNL